MNSQKKIEVNQSSLLSLKAELLRKKQEVRDAKLSDFPNKPTVVTKLKTKLDKINEGVEERNRKDAEEVEEENSILRKSQTILEAKSKLYDELSKKKSAVNSNNFLVDFKNKEDETKVDESAVVDSEDDKIESDYDDDDDEWVDFVDCLGRTKRCHRDDLKSMKENDEKLRRSLFGSAGNREETRQCNEPQPQSLPDIPGQADLCSEDMRREMLRQKWEEEEKNLLDRKDIHYQHVLFDEARSHGVGYYNFSTDEAERQRQMEELNKLRKETVEKQAATQEAATRKKKQMEERLRAARRRKRERLGLPPEEETEETVEEPKPQKPEELKREEQHPTTVRPWDIGKERVHRVLTQEEWIEKKREERPEEFAPPQVTHKKERKKTRRAQTEERYVPEAYLEDMCKSSNLPQHQEPHILPQHQETIPAENSPQRGVGVEIPPPPVLEMSAKRAKTLTNLSDIEKSIEEGLNFIRQQVERKQAQKDKGFVEII